MTFTISIFWDARLWESMSLSFKSAGYRMHTFFVEDYKPHMVKDVDHMISVELSNPNLKINKLTLEMVVNA